MGAKIPQQSSPSYGCSCGFQHIRKGYFSRTTTKGSFAPHFACAHIQLAVNDLTSNHIIFSFLCHQMAVMISVY